MVVSNSCPCPRLPVPQKGTGVGTKEVEMERGVAHKREGGKRGGIAKLTHKTKPQLIQY